MENSWGCGVGGAPGEGRAPRRGRSSRESDCREDRERRWGGTGYAMVPGWGDTGALPPPMQ